MNPANLRLKKPETLDTTVLTSNSTGYSDVSQVILPVNRWYIPFKYTLDWLLALVLMVPAIPLVLISALIVKLTSRGPAFYSQVRVGNFGKPFRIIKIRSMVDKCESLTGPRWSIPGDPRITPFGHFLRLSHLDELPQLLNVLAGQMSLIGPRPERPEFLPDLENALPAYRQRLNLRPGVTGLAQIQLPPDQDLNSVERKLSYDLYYVRHASLSLDFRILVGTAGYALRLPFQWVGQVLGIPGASVIEDEMENVVYQQKETREAA